jgi:maleate isomerase
VTAYAHRGRVGLVVPASNPTAEPELGSLLPPGVAAYATRVPQPEPGPAGEAMALLAVRAGFGRAVDELAAVRPAAIGVAGTGAGYLNGALDDRETCAILSVRAGRPVLTGSRAAVLALRALRVTVVALATADDPALADREEAYLADEGVKVADRVALGVAGPAARGELPVAAARDAARAAYRPGVAAVLLSGAEWPTAGGVPGLERELGVPVVSTATALAWALLRAAGVDDPLPALGNLGVS